MSFLENEAGTKDSQLSLLSKGQRTLLGKRISHYRILTKLGGGKMAKAAERHLDLYPEDTRALYLGAAAMIIYGQKERGLPWRGPRPVRMMRWPD